MDPRFWKKRRVFLTGHTGFKGGWLTILLQGMGANITGYSLPPPTTPSLFNDANVGDCLTSVIGDIRDVGKLTSAMKACRPEVIFHMAAQPLVRASYLDPVETFDVNVMGTVNVMQAARSIRGMKALVNITTDKVYENLELNRGYTEKDRLGGFDPYSSSKACSEIVTASYRCAFFHPDHFDDHGVAVATARSGNVIGGGDWAADRLIPDLVRGFKTATPALIRYPQAVRPWQHVLEPLAGYVRLAECLVEKGPAFSGAWNFGPSPALGRTVGWMADRMVDLWGDGAMWTRHKAKHFHETQNLRLDSRRAQRALGWKSLLDVDATMGWIVDWYRAHATGADVAGLTRQQAADYIRRLSTA